MSSRPTPFDLVFAALADERFPAITESLAARGTDPHNRDAFLLDREAAGVLHELVPDEGAGEGITEHVALLHHAYLFWVHGRWAFSLATPRTRTLLAEPGSSPDSLTHPAEYFVQFPERLLWAELIPDEPHEPLDGIFVGRLGADWSVLGIFGLHPGRSGFTVASAAGPRASRLYRERGEPLFAPVLSGGAAAGLHSIVGQEELLELAARTAPIVAAARNGATRAGPGKVIAIT
jgi:hypothetical protein